MKLRDHRIFVLLMLFLFLITACKIRRSFLQSEEENQKDFESKAHLTLAVPPDEFQTGGKDFFKNLRSVSETHPHIFSSMSQKVFVNQKMDLDLLGPGANVIFATDGSNWGFAVSNGRFDDLESLGKLKLQEYPSRVSWQDPSGVHKNFVEGKYPWPVDHNNEWLNGKYLVTSNSPHGSIEGILKAISKKNSKNEISGGHLGVALDGSVYIGYVSGSASANKNQKYDSDEARKQDERSLPFILRKQFHDVMRSAVKGREIEKVLSEADISDQEILAGKNQDSYLLARSRYFPASGSMFQSEKAKSSSPFELLAQSLSSKALEEYLRDLSEGEVLKNILTNPVKWRSLYQNNLLKDFLRLKVNKNLGDKEFNLLNQAIEYGDLEWVKILIRLGANIQHGLEGVIILKSGREMRQYNVNTPIFLAVTQGKLEILRELIKNGVEINAASGSDGVTLLTEAVMEGRIEIIKLLLEGGAIVEVHEDALSLASREIQQLIAEYKLKEKADFTVKKSSEDPCEQIEKRSK